MAKFLQELPISIEQVQLSGSLALHHQKCCTCFLSCQAYIRHHATAKFIPWSLTFIHDLCILIQLHTGLDARSADPGPGSYTLPSAQSSIAASLKFRHSNQPGAAITDMLGSGASLGSLARKKSGDALPTRKANPAWSIAARLPVPGMAATPGADALSSNFACCEARV